jgi:hypothetical protein
MAAVDEERDCLRFGRGRGGWLTTTCCSKRAPTRMVCRRVVSTAGRSASGSNFDIDIRARVYGSKAPIFAMRPWYSGVHRFGLISATGLSVCWRTGADLPDLWMSIAPVLGKTAERGSADTIYLAALAHCRAGHDRQRAVHDKVLVAWADPIVEKKLYALLSDSVISGITTSASRESGTLCRSQSAGVF